jgi:hypothetical protein
MRQNRCFQFIAEVTVGVNTLLKPARFNFAYYAELTGLSVLIARFASEFK